MSVRYGVPYKGSKNQIAEWVCSHFPVATNFYDLFCGGCSITHAAMLKSDFQCFFINDIDGRASRLFLDSINGQLSAEKRWISREDFFKLKETDPYILFCWSFGNAGEDYLYSREVESWKKALHYAYVFNDVSLFEGFGIKTDGTRRDIVLHEQEYKNIYIKWYCREVLHSSLDSLELLKDLDNRIKLNSEKLRTYLLDGLKKAGKRPCDVDRFLGTNGMAGHYFGRSQWEFSTKDVYEKLKSFLDLPLEYEEIAGLQELLQSLQRLQSLQKSFDEIKILPDSVIYCDIPYKGTSGYFSGFDHDAFYCWCSKQKELVIVSEYGMPEDRFHCIAQIEKSVNLCSGGGKKALERLYIPNHQIGLYSRMMKRSRPGELDLWGVA